MNKKTVRDVDVYGKKVLVRVDFNVPLNSDGEITDDARITAALPTIKYLVENGAKVILMSHLGRPKGIGYEEKFSLKPAAERLSELLGKRVVFASDVIGESAENAVAGMRSGDVVLLENLRFHKEEKKNDPEFAKKLAAFGDVYVNDAFGTAHRAHASTAGVADYLPAVAGFLIEKELEVLGGALDNPKRPFVAVLGGAKVADKIAVIENLLEKADTLIIGGGMAFTFIKAQGHEIGKSLLDADSLDFARDVLARAKRQGLRILLPIDIVEAKEVAPGVRTNMVAVENISPDCLGLDIGKCTSSMFASEIARAKTVFWNGPMGVFEIPEFASGTKTLAGAMADAPDAITIVGGGDSAAAVKMFGYDDDMTHISTGGGASLEFMEGKVLPGVAALNEKE